MAEIVTARGGVFKTEGFGEWSGWWDGRESPDGWPMPLFSPATVKQVMALMVMMFGREGFRWEQKLNADGEPYIVYTRPEMLEETPDFDDPTEKFLALVPGVLMRTPYGVEKWGYRLLADWPWEEVEVGEATESLHRYADRHAV